MSGKKLWMGIPDKHMQWVPAPLAGANSNNNQFTETIQFENGGADARRSKGYHKIYEFEFNELLEGSENLNVFNKFASGFYGDGLCVFADPYIFESNMFSAPWGTPWLVDSGWPNLYDGPPVISDLTGSVTTNLATNPSFEAGSGTVEVRRNLITNPSLETDATGWLTSSASVARSTAQAFVGAASLLVTPSANNGGAIRQFAGTNGIAYIWSCYVFTTVAKNMRLTATNGTSVGATVLVPANTWTRLSVAFTSNGSTSNLFVEGTSDTQPFYVDAAMLEASPALNPYFDGSTSAGGDFTYAWTGTANASASVQNAVGVAGVTLPGGRVAYQSGEWSSSGTKSLRIASSRLDIPASNDTFASPGGDTGGFRLGMEAGKTYTALAKFRQVSPQTGTLPVNARRIEIRGTGAAVLSAAQAANIAGEQILRVTATVPADATQAFIRLYNGASAGNGDVWWDDFMLVEGTYTGDYFDGATADTSLRDFAWTGTANASTSTMTMRDPVNTPAKAATWTITSAVNTPTTGGNHTFTIPVPPGYTLYVGASGTRTGTAVVQALPRAANGFAGTPVNLTLLDPNGTTRMNTTFVGSEELASVTFYLTRTTTAASTITLNSLMAQLYKTGTTPTLPTQHIPGEGHSGLEFVDDARPETYVYINPPRKALSTTLLEVGAWR